MKRITTKDNSITFYNEKAEEWYHSKTGAIEESFEKYVKPSKIKDGYKILDICFGIGYNSLAALHTADVEIVALEKDERIIQKIPTITLPPEYKHLEKEFAVIKNLARDKEHWSKNNQNIKIILGDARINIKQLKQNSFDAVFLDPFSPKKQPELWTYEFFTDIKKVMKKGAILTTYSCARIVRENLTKAGFIVKDGPCIGRRAPSTIAFA
ncbi:tRNA (5-methylaminomethyl-2-thiouridine)(34)-methyltransferase MnmD [Nanoarchaeota archaeon]